MFLLQGFFEFVLRRRVMTLLILFEIGLAFVIYMNVYYIAALTGLPILDMEVGYSIERVNEILGGYGPEGFAHYKLIMLADLIHPAIYGTILAAFIWAFAGPSHWAVLSFLPLFAALFDWGENLFIWQMVSVPLPVNAWLVEAGNVLNLLKHGFLAGSLAVLFLLFLRGMYRAIVA